MKKSPTAELIEKWAADETTPEETDQLVRLLICELTTSLIDLKKEHTKDVAPTRYISAEMIAMLSEVIRVAHMDSYSCTSGNEWLDVAPKQKDSTLVRPDKYIKEKTEHWRMTWIVKPLETLRKRLMVLMEHELEQKGLNNE